MKTKVIFLAISLFFSMKMMSQSVFDKFEDNDEVTAVVISPKMLQMLSKIETKDADSKAFMEIAKKLNTMKIYTTANKSVGQSMKNEIANYLKTNSLSEFMKVKEKGNNVKFYVKEVKNSDIVSELLMFVESTDGDPKTVLMTITGEIDPNKIGTLTKNMNISTK